jgi:hypothetical protein
MKESLALNCGDFSRSVTAIAFGVVGFYCRYNNEDLVNATV